MFSMRFCGVTCVCVPVCATVVLHLLGTCHSPLHSSYFIKVTLLCNVPKEAAMLPPEQKTQQQSTKNTLNKNKKGREKKDPIFHESPPFFQNHGKRQIKKVFVSAELIVATV